MAKSKSPTVSGNTATFQDAFDLWMKVKSPRLSPKTTQMMKSHWRGAWMQWADIPLDQMQSTIDAHYNECQQRFALSTMAVQFIRLGTILNLARERGLHGVRFDLPKTKVPRRPRLVLTEEQVAEFFHRLDAVANLHQSVMIRAMYYLGMREQEAFRLKWSCYDEQTQTYTIDQQKNGEISMLPVAEELARWFARLPRKGIYMCPRADSDHPHGAKYTTKALKQAASAMGISGDFCHHSLRRSLATALARKKVPLLSIQKLLRHSSPDVTAACYVETDIQDMRNALTELG